MQIEYGPPGHKGVTEIMGVGDDGLPADSGKDRARGVARAVGVGAFAVWAYAASAGDKKLRKQARGVAIGAFLARLLLR